MKRKLLVTLLAAMTLVACGSNGDVTPPADPAGPSGPVQPTWKYLGFLNDDKPLRIDLMGDVASKVTLTYGNAALVNGVNSLAFVANAKIGITSTTLTHEDSFNAIIVKEVSTSTSERQAITVRPGIIGDEVMNLQDILADDLEGAGRAYVAFSIGENSEWTKGLNTVMDADITDRLSIIK